MIFKFCKLVGPNFYMIIIEGYARVSRKRHSDTMPVGSKRKLPVSKAAAAKQRQLDACPLIKKPLELIARLEPLLDDKGAEDEMAISRCRTFLPGFALVWTSGRGDASSFSATRGNQGSPGGGRARRSTFLTTVNLTLCTL